MHQNVPFSAITFQNFLRRGQSPLPRLHLREEGDTPPHTPSPMLPRRLRRLALDAFGITTWPTLYEILNTPLAVLA